VPGDEVRAQTRTDGRGRFRIRGGRRGGHYAGRVYLFEMRGPDGRGARFARAVHSDSPGTVDLGLIELGPTHALDVHVVGDGRSVAGALVVAGGGAPRRTDDRGRLAIPLLPKGPIEIRVAADGFGRAYETVAVPHEGPFTVELPPERELVLTVVEKGTEKPVAGATFDPAVRRKIGRMTHLQRFTPPLTIPPTDDEGRTTVRGLGDDVLRLAVYAPGYPPPNRRYGTGRTEVPGTARALTIELDPPRTMRWEIVEPEGARPRPPDGTELRLRPGTGSLREVPARGIVDDGHVVVEGCPPNGLYAVAAAPDGSLASLGTAPVTWFRAPRSIEVVARLPDGSAVAGVVFVVKSQGNVPYQPARVTNDDGRVVFAARSGFGSRRRATARRRRPPAASTRCCPCGPPEASPSCSPFRKTACPMSGSRRRTTRRAPRGSARAWANPGDGRRAAGSTRPCRPGATASRTTRAAS